MKLHQIQSNPWILNPPMSRLMPTRLAKPKNWQKANSHNFLSNWRPVHTDLFFPNVTPSCWAFFPAWVSLPILDFKSEVMQIELASNGLKPKYVPQFHQKNSFTKILQKCAYFCINEFWNSFLRMMSYRNCFDICVGTFTFSITQPFLWPKWHVFP